MNETKTNVSEHSSTKYMPQKEFFAKIAEDYAGTDPEVVAFAEHKLELLNKPRTRKVNQAAVDFAAKVYEEMQTYVEPRTNKELAAEFEVSPQKMAAALRRLVGEAKVTKSDDKPALYSVVTSA